MNKEKTLKHLITYKPSEKYLYDYVETKRCKSSWIKDLIEKHIQDTKENVKK
jgi:hypothetical protein